ALRDKKVKTVGVLEFIPQPQGKLIRATLPSYLAEQMRKTLAERAEGAYTVLPAEKLQAAARGIAIDAIGNPAEMKPLAEQGGAEAVVAGELRRTGDAFMVQCNLMSVKTCKILAKPAGLIPLSEGLLADNGASYDNKDRPTGPPTAPEVVK